MVNMISKKRNQSPFATHDERVDALVERYRVNDILRIAGDRQALGDLLPTDAAIIIQLANMFKAHMTDDAQLTELQFASLERERLYERRMGKAVQATVSTTHIKNEHTLNIKALAPEQRLALRDSLRLLLKPQAASDDIEDAEYTEVENG